MGNPAKLLYRSPSYDGQLSRTVAAAVVGSADLGEALATARRVGKLNGESWYQAWSSTAEVASRAGDRAAAAVDLPSALHAYLRDSEYFRQAYYFIRTDLDGAQLNTAYRRHVETFLAATKHMDHAVTAVRIPYEQTTLSGYLFAPDESDAIRPTLVFPSGYDSTAEAGWVNVPAALERGYNALVFEGPGQGEALMTQRLFFRPDFEAVATPVVDWLVSQPGVDPQAIALVGRSFGGYLAPRAAAFEHRFAALVCDPAQPDMGVRIPQGLIGKVAGPIVNLQARFSEERAEFFGARAAAHGLDSIEAYLAEMPRYTMLADAPAISCPTLIIEAEHDFAGGGGTALAKALTCRHELINLTEQQGADGHCAGLGQQIWTETVYPWLDRTLGRI
jgi:pimeloyl-ACP methyl ester carboxylesterase